MLGALQREPRATEMFFSFLYSTNLFLIGQN